jgi:RNA polymerase sigma factor (sigma-70 family)
MLKIVISSKLAKQIFGINKFADDWRERVVPHITPSGQRGETKIKFLPPEEQEKYRLPSVPQFMPLPQISTELKSYQKSGSRSAFNKLFKNFSPMIAKTVKKVIGPRMPSKDDVDDLRQAANLIFVKALSNADPDNPGLINYFKDTLTKQLEGKSREIFRTTAKINPKDRRLLRIVQKAVHKFEREEGRSPTSDDYEEIAREINDPKSGSRITHATPELIAELMQTGDVSMESEVGGEKEDARQRHELLGPQEVSEDNVDFERYSPREQLFYKSPEEEAIQSNLKSIIEKAIDTLDDPLQRKSIKLFFGFGLDQPVMDEETKKMTKYEGESLGHAKIAELLGVPRRDVRRAIERASIKLKGMTDIHSLSDIFKSSAAMMRTIEACNKHIRFVYTPQKIEKIGSSYFVDDVVITKYSGQLVCSCGKNCFHKDAVRSILSKGE